MPVRFCIASGKGRRALVGDDAEDRGVAVGLGPPVGLAGPVRRGPELAVAEEADEGDARQERRVRGRLNAVVVRVLRAAVAPFG